MTHMKYTVASLEQTKNEIIVACHPRSINEGATTLWELPDAVIRVAPELGEQSGARSAQSDINEINRRRKAS